MSAGIYAITHAATGRRYIGRAVNLPKRLARHRAMLHAGRHDNVRLQRAWDKYGEGAFVFAPVLLCAPAHLEFYEQRLIDGYDAVRRGFNICPVSGAPMAGRTNTAASNARRSVAQMGRIKPQAVREKLSIALRGVTHPPERVAANRSARSTPAARAATSARMLGNKNGLGSKRTDEQKKKLSASWTPERKAALAERMRNENPRKKAR
jgi:group I intron endonuclease